MRRSLTARALACLALSAGFWLLGAGLVGSLVGVVVLRARDSGALDPGAILPLSVAAAVAWSLRPRAFLRRHRDRPEPLGVETFPELHRFVAELARRVGVAPPEELQLGSSVNASMGAERRRLRRHRVLTLGLPLFTTLDEAELSAVVAHELAHECGGDVALGGWVYRTHTAVLDAVESLEGSALWLDLPFRAYGALFLRASAAVSRAQERAADQLGARVAGRTAAWEALRKIGAYGDAWAVYHELSVRPALDRGLRVPLADGFARFLAEPRRSAEVRAALAAAEARPPSPHDTHPPIPERLALVDPSRSPALRVSSPTGCTHLLGGPAAAEDAWYSRFGSGRLTPAEWGEAAARGLVPAMGEALAGTPLELSRFRLSDLPALVAGAAALWPSIRRGVTVHSPAVRERAARDAISAALAVALAARGWVPEVRPGAALTLRRGARAAVPDEVVAGLADGSLSAPEYATICAEWSASGSAPVDV